MIRTRVSWRELNAHGSLSFMAKLWNQPFRLNVRRVMEGPSNSKPGPFLRNVLSRSSCLSFYTHALVVSEEGTSGPIVLRWGHSHHCGASWDVLWLLVP